MTGYVILWTEIATFPIMPATGIIDNGWTIEETGFTFAEVNEIFFHRVEVNHNEITNSPQYGAVNERSDTITRPAQGKEIGVAIKLSTLVERFPSKVFITPAGVPVAPHGSNVEGYNKRLVIPAWKSMPYSLAQRHGKAPESATS